MNKTILSTLSALSITALSANAAEWDNSFDLGATVTKGNSDSLLLTAGLSSKLKEQSDEYIINLFYTYGESDNSSTNDEILANVAWKHLMNEKTYAGARFDFLRDDIADLNYRTSLTGVVGRHLVKNDTTTFSLEGGLGYSLEEQGGLTDDYAHLYVGQFFEHKLNDKTKVYQSFTAFAPIDNFDNYNFIAEAGLETTLTEKLSLKLYVQDKYDAVPAAGSKSNDIKFVTGISYKF